MALDDPGDSGITGSSYWFNTFMLQDARKVHEYLDSLDASGKVISIDTAMRMLGSLRDGKTLDDFFLSIVYKRLPEEVAEVLFRPYLSADGNQLRFSVRVIDSLPDLRRAERAWKCREHRAAGVGNANILDPRRHLC